MSKKQFAIISLLVGLLALLANIGFDVPLNTIGLILGCYLLLAVASGIPGWIKDLKDNKRGGSYIIKKGRHYAWPPHISFLKIRDINLAYHVTFTGSCLYNLKDVNDDINKLMGFSDGIWPKGFKPAHQINSYRIGWRPTLTNIQLFAYYYIDGQRTFKYLQSVELNAKTYCSISIVDDKVIYQIGNEKFIVEHRKPLHKCGYELNIYFGGDKPAPHDMIIYKESVENE